MNEESPSNSQTGASGGVDATIGGDASTSAPTLVPGEVRTSQPQPQGAEAPQPGPVPNPAATTTIALPSNDSITATGAHAFTSNPTTTILPSPRVTITHALPARPPPPKAGYPSHDLDVESDSDIEIEFTSMAGPAMDIDAATLAKPLLPPMPGGHVKTIMDKKLMMEARAKMMQQLGIPLKKKKRPNKTKRRGGKKSSGSVDEAGANSDATPEGAEASTSSAQAPAPKTIRIQRRDKLTILALPYELIAEITSYFRTSDLLALSRTSKWFCATLINPTAAWMWRRARERCIPIPLPDPNANHDTTPNLPAPTGAIVVNAAFLMAAFGIVMPQEFVNAAAAAAGADQGANDVLLAAAAAAATEGLGAGVEGGNATAANGENANTTEPSAAPVTTGEDDETRQLRERFPKRVWTEWAFAAMIFDAGPCNVSYWHSFPLIAPDKFQSRFLPELWQRN